MRVGATYADNSLYQRQEFTTFWPTIVYKPTGARLDIAFYSDNGTMTENSIVRGILLDPSKETGTSISHPTISEVQRVLGSPIRARLATGVDNYSIALFYGDGRSSIFVADTECDQVPPDGEIISISMNDRIPTEGSWLSDPQDWHGFNYCYNFVRKVS